MTNNGYYDSSKLPYRVPDVKLERHTVICKNCNATWKEEMPALTAIAGYARKYDFCSLCEQKYTSSGVTTYNSIFNRLPSAPSIYPTIIYRSVKCLSCGDVLVSRHRHDFSTCECESITVDGGFDYLKFSSENAENISIFEVTEKDPFELIRAHIEWGSRGKDGKGPIKFIKLKDMEAAHIENLKKYFNEKNIKPPNKIHLFLDKELKYREDNSI
jgi:hypothetical protein